MGIQSCPSPAPDRWRPRRHSCKKSTSSCPTRICGNATCLPSICGSAEFLARSGNWEIEWRKQLLTAFRSASSSTARLFLCRYLIEVVSPPLHHLPAFRQVLCMIVGGADVVPLAVGKLPF